MQGSDQFITTLVYLAMSAAAFLLFRWVVLWYFKITELVESQKKIVELLTVLVERSRKDG